MADPADALLSADIALNAVIEEWVGNYQSSANDETSEESGSPRIGAVLHQVLRTIGRSG